MALETLLVHSTGGTVKIGCQENFFNEENGRYALSSAIQLATGES